MATRRQQQPLNPNAAEVLTNMRPRNLGRRRQFHVCTTGVASHYLSLRDYGPDATIDAAAIQQDITSHGSSEGWTGLVTQRQALAAILNPLGIHYVNHGYGRWQRPETYLGGADSAPYRDIEDDA